MGYFLAVAVVDYCFAVAAVGRAVLAQAAAPSVDLYPNPLNHSQSHHRQNHPGGQPTQPPARNAVESLEVLSTEHRRIGSLQEARAI